MQLILHWVISVLPAKFEYSSKSHYDVFFQLSFQLFSQSFVWFVTLIVLSVFQFDILARKSEITPQMTWGCLDRVFEDSETWDGQFIGLEPFPLPPDDPIGQLYLVQVYQAPSNERKTNISEYQRERKAQWRFCRIVHISVPPVSISVICANI